VRAGASASDVLLKHVYAFQNEKRAADIVTYDFAAAPAQAEPDEATLQRWYDNHADEFTTPELRRIKAIILSPETLSKDLTVSDDELKTAYDQHRAQYVTPGKRSAQVVTIGDQEKAQQLTLAWQAGADWTRIQQEAASAGGSAVELDDATQAEFPSPELGQAVFAATPDTVPAPVKTPLGWNVLKVVHEIPGTDRPFDTVKDELRDAVLHERATDLMYDRANQIDGLLGNGTSLDELPSDLGVAAVAGTLDAKGNTPAGDPAPIPGPAELRTALIAAAFQTRVGDPPHLTEVNTPSVGGSAYYALAVEDIAPPTRQPFAAIREQVEASWRRDAMRHAENEAASKLLAALQDGQSMEDAATVAGVHVERTPAVTRSAPVEGMPSELIEPLFRLKQGEATMIETKDGFIVAQLAAIDDPDPAADPAGMGQLKDALTRAVADDLEITFASAVRDRGKPELNRTQLDSIVQSDQ
jgi:peptidyl-prolyl cis-trans isomerase D